MITDQELKENVINQLKFEPILQDTEIGVQVQDGIVTLFGNVNTYLQKISAETAVRKVSGVRALAEDIQVLPSTVFTRTDTEIAADVLSALKEKKSLPKEKIIIKVEEGAVTLEGQVEWEHQVALAVKTIQSIAGVRLVNNHLILKPVTSIENIKQKILEAFHKSAAEYAKNITVELAGRKVILKGIVRSLGEKEDAERAARSAGGVLEVENNLVALEDDWTCQ